MVDFRIESGDYLIEGTPGDDNVSFETLTGTTNDGGDGTDAAILESTAVDQLYADLGGAGTYTLYDAVTMLWTTPSYGLQSFESVAFPGGFTMVGGTATAEDGFYTEANGNGINGDGSQDAGVDQAFALSWDGTDLTVGPFDPTGCTITTVAGVAATDGDTFTTADGAFSVNSATDIEFTPNSSALVGNVGDMITFEFDVVLTDDVTAATKTVPISYTFEVGFTDNADTYVGDSSDNNEDGLLGDDMMDGGDGNDTLDGSGGDDFIRGQGGNDTLYGEDDDDRLRGGTGNDDLEGGSGDDDLRGGGGNDSMSGGDDMDVLFGGNGNDSMYGGDGADVMGGGAGDEYTMDGGSGDDTMYGGAGNDDMYGGAGEDLIFGGAGNDSMDGGSGDDVFKFAASGDGNDYINDFGDTNSGDDRLDLRAAGIDDDASLDAVMYEANIGGTSGVMIQYSATDSVFLEGVSIGDMSESDLIT